MSGLNVFDNHFIWVTPFGPIVPAQSAPYAGNQQWLIIQSAKGVLLFVHDDENSIASIVNNFS
jgi:hypothetical protein